MSRKRVLSFAVGAVLALVWLPATVGAHAVPEWAVPSIEGIVPVAPSTVEIRFTEEVATEGLSVRVLGPRGVRVDGGDAAVDLFDPERRRVTLSLRGELLPGTYVVQWQTASGVDRDTASGSYRFTIDPAATPAATPATVPPLAPTPTATVARPDGARGERDLVWPLALFVVVLLLGGWVLLRQRRRGAARR